METKLKELLKRYLDQASAEEKHNLVQSYRSLERYFLDNMLDGTHTNLQSNFIETSVFLEDTAIEVGLEPNESYYTKLTEELKEKHRQLEENKELVEELVPIEAWKEVGERWFVLPSFLYHLNA